MIKLQYLTLKNFRNLYDARIEFARGITVLIGNNAQGKTNFLESVYLLSRGKPIKAETDEEVIKFFEESVNVEGEIKKKGESIKVGSVIQKVEDSLKKRLFVNGIPRRLLDYSGNLIVVFFRPEDIDLVTGSPSIRRGYIDETIGQVDREYRKILGQYQKVVIRKNKLLKLIREGFARVDELDYWNLEQFSLGKRLQEMRSSYFEKVNSFEKKFGDFEYKYLPNFVSKEKLEELKTREIQASISLIGPHRDDFQFFMGEKDLAKYGSRGEQRTAVLDLKITELSFVEAIAGERPVLLLDDIFSELDESHRKHVLDLSALQQTIIATVEYDEYLKMALKDEQVFEVSMGKLTPLNGIAQQ